MRDALVIDPLVDLRSHYRSGHGEQQAAHEDKPSHAVSILGRQSLAGTITKTPGHSSGERSQHTHEQCQIWLDLTQMNAKNPKFAAVGRPQAGFTRQTRGATRAAQLHPASRYLALGGGAP
ncbi:hypothetical protein D3C78_1290430 [compost metagenome]